MKTTANFCNGAVERSSILSTGQALTEGATAEGAFEPPTEFPAHVAPLSATRRAEITNIHTLLWHLNREHADAFVSAIAGTLAAQLEACLEPGAPVELVEKIRVTIMDFRQAMLRFRRGEGISADHAAAKRAHPHGRTSK